MSQGGSARRRVVAVIFILGLSLASPAAHAEPCLPTDAGCVDDPVKDAVEAIEDEVETVLEDAGDGAEDTADAVGDQVDGAVAKIREVVDGILDPGGEGGGDPKEQGGAGGRGRPEAPALRGREVREPAFASPSDQASRPSARAISRRSGSQGGLGRAAAEVAGRLAFPLALALAVLCFVALQDRLDKRDPRLALAPLDPDFLKFE